MIKKIVKYGNSYALRLDRTILALLGLEDGELVKLRIEGEALIIKAAKNLQPLDLILAESDEMNEVLGGSPVLEKKASELKQKVKENPDYQKELTDWVPGSEKRENLGNEYQNIFQKNKKIFDAFTSPEALEEFNHLKQEFQTGKVSFEEYTAKMLETRKKYCPDIEEFDKELIAATKEIYPS